MGSYKGPFLGKKGRLRCLWKRPFFSKLILVTTRRRYGRETGTHNENRIHIHQEKEREEELRQRQAP